MGKLFLVRYPNKPWLVPENKTTTIGRTDQCDIILTEARVSRRHAVIEWLEPSQAFGICDLGSSNGTYLNNTKLAGSPTPLKDWDKIRVASAVFTVRIVDEASIIMNEFEALRAQDQFKGTEIFNLADCPSPSGPPGFTGDLSHFCPVELFQILEMDRKSGILTIKNTGGEGIFSISGGQVVHARYRDLSGAQAMYAILSDNRGTFTFRAQQVSFEQAEITMSTTFLLMEGCRLLDEAARNKSSLPAGAD